MSVPIAFRARIFLPAVVAGILVAAGLAALWAASNAAPTDAAAEAEPYNQMVAGFRSGHVWLPREAPPALAKAADPYQFAAYRPFLRAPWNLTDLSYYRGHLYSYFGVTPAVILFWPYRVLTGSWLAQADAVLIFCVLGYAVALGLAVALWRRYFPQVGAWAGAALALLLGSVTTLPVFVVRAGVYEVPISCAFALVMLALAALWNAWHRPRRNAIWLAAASLAYGLAVGARPSLLFGAAILFLPAVAALRTGMAEANSVSRWRTFLAALLPISAVGAGLAAYNFLRFGHPFQFGHDYQLSGNDVHGTKAFAPGFFWDNFRLYFLEPVRWHAGFPYVWKPAVPPLSPAHLPVEFFFGLLTNLPILLAAAFVPLAWSRPGCDRGPGPGLRGMLFALAVLFFAAVIPVASYAGATSRYLLDFAPALALLALVGILNLESSGGRVSVLRGLVGGAIVYSIAIGWLLGFALSGFYREAKEGSELLNAGWVEDGIAVYRRLCATHPDFQGQADLSIGAALLDQGRPLEAAGYLREATKDQSNLAAAPFNLGLALLQLGRFEESAEAFRRAAALDPLDAGAEAQLGVVLSREGRIGEAIEHLRSALRIDPALTQARQALQVLESSAKSLPQSKP